jgi:hypothetical protein
LIAAAAGPQVGQRLPDAGEFSLDLRVCVKILLNLVAERVARGAVEAGEESVDRGAATAEGAKPTSKPPANAPAPIVPAIIR